MKDSFKNLKKIAVLLLFVGLTFFIFFFILFISSSITISTPVKNPLESSKLQLDNMKSAYISSKQNNVLDKDNDTSFSKDLPTNNVAINNDVQTSDSQSTSNPCLIKIEPSFSKEQLQRAEYLNKQIDELMNKYEECIKIMNMPNRTDNDPDNIKSELQQFFIFIESKDIEITHDLMEHFSEDVQKYWNDYYLNLWMDKKCNGMILSHCVMDERFNNEQMVKYCCQQFPRGMGSIVYSLYLVKRTIFKYKD